MTYQQVLENARTCIGPYCKACNDCNGKVCRNTMPGPGAKGEGTGFIRNAEKWREICVNMDTICENSPVDTSFTLFGRTFEIPAFAAPVGAMRLHYGDKYDDLTYNDILVRACANAGILAFTGDGTDPKVVGGAAAALKGNGGCGVVSFNLKGGRRAAEAFMKRLKLAAIETHVADARTCCLNPATTTHRQMTDEQLAEAGVPAGLVRLSCGLEDKEDLLADLKQALAGIE